MSTHKHFDKICCVVLALTLLITVLFVGSENLGIQKASTVMGYKNAVFDNTKIHTIDIIMDNWDEFIENCKSEEYYNCSVVIDNEAYKNVAIRGKGNTSLSSVDSYGNNRYSFKIEFDHYDNTKTYHGLDKLVLNNLIQDNTYMKDYLTYQMMAKMGVAAPLCSYAYITVNGEDWGLYLAVEGVEESFLLRNYGKDYGELYKPDSLSMGGGRGNGKDFNMDMFTGNTQSEDEATSSVGQQPELNKEEETTTAVTEESNSQSEEKTENETAANNTPELPQLPEKTTPPDMSENPFGAQMPEGMTPPNMNGNPFGSNMSGNESYSDINGKSPNLSQLKTSYSTYSQATQIISSSFAPPSNAEMPSPEFIGGFNFNIKEEAVREAFNKLGLDEALLDGIDFDNISLTDIMTLMSKLDENTIEMLMQEIMSSDASGIPTFDGDKIGGFSGSMPGGFGGMGSSDVKLQYSDDNIDSYQNIFNNAKTDITNADKKRLIEALKSLGSADDLENTVSIDEVIRYFVVHNFVVNSDSYTGTMIHNYYLYEKDGKLQMIPWDYNLAFGSFMSTGDATASVNDPIDTPLSVSSSGDRPMIDWIFNIEEYTSLYHQYFSEFISLYFDNGYFEEFFDTTVSMISPYVKKDPTKFCTYDEFQKGTEVLKEFCTLRTESIKGQLNGTIGTTTVSQTSETLIDASHLNTSDMGSMGGMGGKGEMNFPTADMQRPQNNSDNTANDETTAEKPSEKSKYKDDAENNTARPQSPDVFQNGNIPDFSFGDFPQQNIQQQKPAGKSISNNGLSQFSPQGTISSSSLMLFIASILLLVFGLIFALKFKRKR